MPAVVAQPGFERRRIDAAPPGPRHQLDVESQPARHLGPALRELADVERQHGITGRERVDERRFPRAAPRRRINHHRPRRLEDPLQALQHLAAERRELRRRDGRSSAAPSRAARDRACWSARESAGSDAHSDTTRQGILTRIISLRTRFDPRAWGGVGAPCALKKREPYDARTCVADGPGFSRGRRVLMGASVATQRLPPGYVDPKPVLDAAARAIGTDN